MESIEQIEKRLWSSADNLRANSNYASNEYFLPVMGLIFLRHAFSRFERVKAQVEPTLPKRAGIPRALRREEFFGRGAIFLGPEARYDYLVALPEDRDLARAIVHAPRTFNDPALKRASGESSLEGLWRCRELSERSELVIITILL